MRPNYNTARSQPYNTGKFSKYLKYLALLTNEHRKYMTLFTKDKSLPNDWKELNI